MKRSLALVTILVTQVIQCIGMASLSINTDKGIVVGTETDGVRQFYGVPYAASPIGSSRWMPPREHPSWATPIDATSESKCQCECREDCLKLDIYTPLHKTGLRPVVVFLHGGAFISGNSGNVNGSNLVRNHGIVLVSLNYRLGAFGWLALEGTDVTGNYGLKDQRQGLIWVQRNIRAFGGDPDKVTVAGESAGAMSIGALMAGSKSSGLFTAAIMESNVVGYKYRSVSDGKGFGTKFAKHVPACSNSTGNALLACLRSQPFSILKIASHQVTGTIYDFFDLQKNILNWAILVDGDEVSDQVLNVFAAGKQMKVPVLMGANINEFDYFVPHSLRKHLTNPELDAFIAAQFGIVDSLRIRSWYPSHRFPDTSVRLSRIVTDWMFICASDRMAKYHSDLGIPTFLYRFDKDSAPHGLELPYVFGSDINFMGFVLHYQDNILSRAMQEYWTSFARSRIPVSALAGVEWPSKPELVSQLVFNSSNRSNLDITHQNVWDVCTKLWDSVGYYHTTDLLGTHALVV